MTAFFTLVGLTIFLVLVFVYLLKTRCSEGPLVFIGFLLAVCLFFTVGAAATVGADSHNHPNSEIHQPAIQ